MKLNPNFVIRQVAETWVILPLAEESLNLNGMLALNTTGVFLWKILEKGAERVDLIKALTATYEVDDAQAAADIDEFINSLKEHGCIIT